MRIVLGLLVLANLGFFAWAHWIAPEAVAPADPLKPAVPRLMLAREMRQAPPASVSPGPPPTGAAATAAAAVSPDPASPAEPIRCVTIGPFAVAEAASRAAAAFRSDGYEPVERQVAADAPDGYWVYIGDLESLAMQHSLVERLQDSGIPDAREMPRTAAGLRVSLGVFSERTRAARRAAAVSRLGLKAEISEHTRPVSVYWLDLKPRSGTPALKPEELASLNQSGGALGVQPCPASEGTPAAAAPPAPAQAPPAPAPAPAVAPGAAPARTASG